MNLSIIIPSYNEAKNIKNVVRKITKIFQHIEREFEIIVVDNGSTDETSEILRSLTQEIPRLKTVRISINRGYGNGILAGLSLATGSVLSWMHADEQVNSEDVKLIYKKLISENLDLCKGARIVRKEHPFRIIQSTIYNLLFRLLFGGSCYDINGTPKFFRRSLYEKVKLQSLDWFLDAEIMIKTIAEKCKIGEVEIIWESRKHHSTNVRATTVLEFLKNMIAYRFSKKL